MSDYPGSLIFVIGAECYLCGYQSESNDLEHYIERRNGDRIKSICRNAQLCAERRKISGSP